MKLTEGSLVSVLCPAFRGKGYYGTGKKTGYCTWGVLE